MTFFRIAQKKKNSDELISNLFKKKLKGVRKTGESTRENLILAVREPVL